MSKGGKPPRKKAAKKTWPRGSYPVTYAIRHHPEGMPRAWIEEHNRKNQDDLLGATHALFCASILYPPDGTLSVLFGSMDGRKPDGGELDDIEWFKVWTMLASRLATSKTLPEDKRQFAAVVFEMYRRMQGVPPGTPT